MYVCMYVHVCTCMYVYCMYVYTYICTYVNTELKHATKPLEVQFMETTINNGLDKLQSYFKANKLSRDVCKCTFVLVRTQQNLTKHHDTNIKMGNESIPHATKSKHQDVLIENIQRWNAYIHQLVKKLSSKVGYIKKTLTHHTSCSQTNWSIVFLCLQPDH